MKHLTAAIAVLVIIISFCVWNIFFLGGIIDDTSELMAQAVELAKEDKWNEARELCSRASDYWYGKKNYLGMVLNHNESDEISSGFPALDEMAQTEDLQDFTAKSAEIISKLGHIKDMEMPDIGNIF